MIERGGIYLAKLYPSRGAEPGKIRPVLIIQSDLLTQAGHQTVIVLPLSTRLIDDAEPLRVRISRRQRLEKDSDVLCDQIRALDVSRIVSEKLAVLGDGELQHIAAMVALILEIEP